ncbi:MAG: hypothetical protein J0I82_00520 [Spirosoma sp.]|nr:hypothetical protein [Spirosoma sp.]OJW72684.1 MAG: hypothetical protein BGO59_16350 [Spirosoma sp. 48-14]
MRLKSSLYQVTLLTMISLGVGCQSTNTSPTPDDSTYFPIQTGDYWIYQVTQETYTLTGAPTTRTYQLQQKISNSYTQNGQVVYQVEESIKLPTQSDWQINAIRTVYKNLSEVISQDGNVPKLQLLFPVAASTSWNLNTYNANPDTVLHYQDAGRPFKVGSQTFDHTVSVLGTNDSTLINQQKYSRVYAQNVGLVYRENTSLAYCQSTPDCIGKGIISAGSRQKWSLIASNRLN